jgi:hypothetical protein
MRGSTKNPPQVIGLKRVYAGFAGSKKLGPVESQVTEENTFPHQSKKEPTKKFTQ